MSTCWCRRFTPGGAERLLRPTLRKPYRGIAISPSLINQRRKIDLRSERWNRQRLLIVKSIGSESLSEGNCTPCLHGVEEKKESVKQSSIVEKEEDGRRRRDRDRTVEVLVAATATVVLGVGNRVLYKLALVPLKHYPFFLAQLATFGYVLVYFSVLYARYHAGIVTDEMLSLPKTPFLLVGLFEALAAASGMAAGAVLSGASIPILSQTFLVWQLLLSAIFLGRKYRFNQILGCFLVSVGVIITVASGSGGGLSLKDAGIFWALLMITSFLFQAGDTVLKEVIFLDARKRLKGGSVDLFVVNSYGSGFQALFICLLLPFLSKLWGVPFLQLPSYLRDGAACFLNIGTLSTGCEGAPWLPLLFVIVNMGFNISLLHLLKISSAVVSCLASTFSVPLSVYAFTLPLPYIGVASSLPNGFVAGVAVLVSGLLIYCWSSSATTTTTATPSTTTPSSLDHPHHA
ncbi:protein CLT1, chloroplastic [Macadamia integrifolia]|uniref:protein CLT1, chloroplastic n=1 Tax=Macadamia integrifolia TaxID=60698 RepID=UPI001C527FEA|nr:protein CLT1, chloroplastic [Macadamia integrifolia]XP_042520571.1 protein CLT1, chloroplastic [Macadamia integrifolia]